MANIFSRLFGKKPARPASEKGERGTGRGKLHVGEVEEFVLEGVILFVSSSNVSAMQYHKDEHTLMIEFKDGKAYLYRPISESLAYTFAEVGSKGGAVWDYLRVRGPGGDYKSAPGITTTRIR